MYQGSGDTSCSGMLCDLDLNIVQHDEDTAARVALILPYDHCPLESLRQCYLAQEELIITDKIAIHSPAAPDCARAAGNGTNIGRPMGRLSVLSLLSYLSSSPSLPKAELPSQNVKGDKTGRRHLWWGKLNFLRIQPSARSSAPIGVPGYFGIICYGPVILILKDLAGNWNGHVYINQIPLWGGLIIDD
ncbi:hypothetical protein E4U14_008206 [Claviceps sp. LM454 group G7]|nr:hypothetical protein E4U14_008206 [Claviceps sp. LM454 group G7]